jgi:hypothetical protein
MISVKTNIETFKKRINELAVQRNEITNEILRFEGAVRVLVDMEKAGVSEIPITKNPLETSEVIDSGDVQASGSN